MLEFQDLVGTIQWFSVLQLFEFEFSGCLINAVPFTTGTQIEIWTDLVKPIHQDKAFVFRLLVCLGVRIKLVSFVRKGVSFTM